MFRSFSILAVLLLSFQLHAQLDSVIVVFSIEDIKYKEAIHNVSGTFSYLDKNTIKSSNIKGKITLKVPADINLEYQLTHVLYEPISGMKKIRASNSGDTLFFPILMQRQTVHEIKEVVVKAPGTPDTIFESKRLSVSDFEIQKDGRLVLLTYPKQLKKGSEILLYNGVEIENTFNVPGVAEELVRDYRGNCHILCKENVYGLYINDEQIGISNLEKDYYLKYIAPIVDTNHTKMFFSNFNKDYPAFNYFTFDQLDSTYQKIVHIEDELMMELYRSEYKWVDVRTKLWAKNKEIETGIDAEIWVGANYFTQSIYYKELYAPMFIKNDSVYVFDYYKDKLYTFNRFGEKIDSIGIYHHYNPKSTGWKKELVQDRETGEVYAVFELAGYTYVGRIDLQTGIIGEKVRLEFRYVDKVAVNSNFVYYIYRPFESTQKKFLYKERLPYNFEKASVPQGAETSIETGK